MMSAPAGNKGPLVWPILVALTASLFFFLAFGWMRVGIADEGYLWYGVQRVLAGEVPIRDFMSYDPGRYYLIAGMLAPFGLAGPISVRAANAAIHGIAIGVAIYVLFDKSRTPIRQKLIQMAVVSVSLLLWGFVLHKRIEMSASLLLVSAFFGAAARPSAGRIFGAGATVGLAAVFGRNLGVYGAVGGIFLLAALGLRGRLPMGFPKSFLAAACGIATGFLPVLAMVLFVPGFAQSFLGSILYITGSESTNITLSLPWPWTPEGRSLFGLVFQIQVLSSAGLLVWLFFGTMANTPRHALLAACAALALPFLHHALSRADPSHLATSIAPVVVAGFAIVLGFSNRSLVWAGMAVMLFFCCSLTTPRWRMTCNFGTCADAMTAQGERFVTSKPVAERIKLVDDLASRYGAERPYLAAPAIPTLYAVRGAVSPAWELYGVLPQTEAFQLAEVNRLKSANIAFAIIDEKEIDGREDLVFKETRPIIWKYLQSDFVVEPSSVDGVTVFVAKDLKQP